MLPPSITVLFCPEPLIVTVLVMSAGAAITVTHEDLAVTEPSERIHLPGGVSGTLAGPAQLLYFPWLESGVGRGFFG